MSSSRVVFPCTSAQIVEAHRKLGLPVIQADDAESVLGAINALVARLGCRMIYREATVVRPANPGVPGSWVVLLEQTDFISDLKQNVIDDRGPLFPGNELSNFAPGIRFLDEVRAVQSKLGL